MKYIILSDNTPIIFPDSVSHKNMANGRQVKSAGFCRIETRRNEYDDVVANVCCWGNSDSLGINSQTMEDEKIIASMFMQ